MNRQEALTASLLLLAGLLLFLPGLGTPAQPYFDEVHYIPAARQLLVSGPVLVREHPPLGKELISLGILVWGDTPFGWRFMSALFGAVTLATVYLLGLALFGEEKPALWAALLTAVNQVLYVQSRIAMLDIFLLTFVLLALTAFAFTWSRRAPAKPFFAITGLCLGLAVACKWVGVLPWAMCVAIVLLVQVLRHWRTRFEDQRTLDWYHPDLWQGMGVRDWVLCLGLLPAAVYFLTFLPVYGLSLAAILGVQADMWHDNATLATPHPYMSSWISWPLQLRPIWYLFEKLPDHPDRAQAVLYLGNPLVMWGGLAAMILCLWDWLVRRRADAFLILASFLALYVPWMIIPRKVAFLFYYLPAAILLSLALAYAFHRTALARRPWAGWAFLALAGACFVYFLPITSAPVTVTIAAFQQMMWFDGWR